MKSFLLLLSKKTETLYRTLNVYEYFSFPVKTAFRPARLFGKAQPAENFIHRPPAG